MMSINITAQVLLSPQTERLLFANGRIDKELNKTIAQGWSDLCAECGWEEGGTTPAKERYIEGWNSVRTLGVVEILH